MTTSKIKLKLDNIPIDWTGLKDHEKYKLKLAKIVHKMMWSQMTTNKDRIEIGQISHKTMWFWTSRIKKKMVSHKKWRGLERLELKEN